MKKFTLFLLTVVLLLSCTGCAKIEPVTPEYFQTTMQDAGFEVVDYTDKSSMKDIVQCIYIALKDDYQIELYCFVDEASAQKYYNATMEEVEDQAGSNVNVSMPDHARYELTSSTSYTFVAWAGNTILYSKCAKAEKDAVRSAIELLGYV